MHLYLSLDTSFGYIFVVTLNAVKLTLFIYKMPFILHYWQAFDDNIRRLLCNVQFFFLDFQATERIFRKVVHPGLDSLRLVDKNGVPVNTPLSSMKQKMFILSPRGVPTRVTNHAYSGQPMRMSRPYSEGVSN